MPPVAAELDVEDGRSVGAHEVELPSGRQFVQLELAAFRLAGDEDRAVRADVDVHDPGGTVGGLELSFEGEGGTAIPPRGSAHLAGRRDLPEAVLARPEQRGEACG